MARQRRRITAGESRMLRNLVNRGLSKAEISRQFRARAKHLANAVLDYVTDALRAGYRGNINDVLQVEWVRAGDARRAQFADLIARKLNRPVRVTATGFVSGTAAVSIEKRDFEQPFASRTVTVTFISRPTLQAVWEAEAARRISSAVKLDFASVVAQIREANSDFAAAISAYGRIAIVSRQAEVTSIVTSPA